MRALAEFADAANPDVLAVCEMDAGDAFALATRFAREWAYRGAQALFWTRRFAAHEVHDLYLPFVAARPFDRRGLLRVDGSCDGEAMTLFATQFATERAALIPELRFARGNVRASARATLLFAQSTSRVAFAAGFAQLAREEHDGLRVYARGFGGSVVATHKARGGIGAAVTLRVERTPDDVTV